MTTTTISKTTGTKTTRKRRSARKVIVQAEPEKCAGASKTCETCRAGRKPHKATKKKPMYKLGSWRGAFRGTLDF